MSVAVSTVHRLLVIKLSALGDFVISFRSFDALRGHFPSTEITLLTTKPLQRLAEATGWFDQVWVDERPAIGKVHQFFALRRRILRADFDLVIDLQNNDRTSLYYHLTLPRQPRWSGIACGCDYHHSRQAQKKWHAIDRESTQLEQLGITRLQAPRLNWLSRVVGSKSYRVTKRTVLMVAGCSPKHPEKLWPPEKFAAAATAMIAAGWQVTLVGTQDDALVNARVKSLCPEVRDLTGGTNLLELAALGQQAGCVLGNDTGPMHLLASCGCRSLVLFGGSTYPERSAPRGGHVDTLQQTEIRRIEIEDVLKVLGLPEAGAEQA
ncbi:MAG: glycosyltransferase family 9 protein [Alphaproteobacteria bacterium]|nr:glycosyltransferase family 9 protein [Alphaproteobacteria bacterium]